MKSDISAGIISSCQVRKPTRRRYPMTETLYVGLDLGSRNCEQLGMLSDGTVRVKNRFQTSEANLIKAFKGLGKELEWEIQVHLESGELAPWVREVIKPYVKSV